MGLSVLSDIYGSSFAVFPNTIHAHLSECDELIIFLYRQGENVTLYMLNNN